MFVVWLLGGEQAGVEELAGMQGQAAAERAEGGWQFLGRGVCGAERGVCDAAPGGCVVCVMGYAGGDMPAVRRGDEGGREFGGVQGDGLLGGGGVPVDAVAACLAQAALCDA